MTSKIGQAEQLQCSRLAKDRQIDREGHGERQDSSGERWSTLSNEKRKKQALRRYFVSVIADVTTNWW